MAASTQTEHLLEFGPFRLDPNERLLLREGKPVQLTPKAFETLLALVRRGGRVVGKDELMEAVWPDNFVEEIGLTRNISVIRKALGDDPAAPRYIETVPKLGYRFIAAVREVPREEVRRVGAQAYAQEVSDRGYEGRPPVEEVAQTPGQGLELRPAPADTAPAGPWPARHPALVVVGLLLLALTVAAVYRLSMGGGAEAGQLHSIAVLPFKPINSEAADEALELGMADALIAKLSSIRQIEVRPTRAVLKYAGQVSNLQAVGRELGVDSVLDGTVQRSGDRVRVTVQFVSVRDGKHLWSGTFNGRWTDLFAVQDAISTEVAQSLALHMSKEVRELLTKRYTENIEAYQAYLKGRYFWNRRTSDGFKKAVAYFQQAIAEDPVYAPAYAGLADSYLLLNIFGVLPQDETIPRARAAATKALEIDSTLAEAHTTLAFIKELYVWDFKGAEQDFRRAIELNPSYATAHQWYALYLSSMGRRDEAVAEIRRARELDPLSLPISSDVGLVLFLARRYDEAIAEYKKVLEMDPNFIEAHDKLGWVYLHKGVYDEAEREFQKAIELSGNNYDRLGNLGYLYAVSGRRREAVKVLQQLKELTRHSYIPEISMAGVYSALGERDEVFRILEHDYERRAAHLVDFNIHPNSDPLRSDPRFADLVRRIGQVPQSAEQPPITDLKQ